MSKSIIDVQETVINILTVAGYSNIKDNMLVGFTESETYPVVVIDIDSSVSMNISSGAYTPFLHYLTISCYQKASIGISEARKDAVDTLNAVLSIINLEIVENNISYVDTIMNNIRLCGAGCLVEIGAY